MTTEDAILARFEKSLSSHSWSTARFFRRGAESLLGYCAERGHDIIAGDVSRSLLCEFVEATEPERRLLRGAVAFCRFLRNTGVRLPLMDDPGLELLSQEQLAVFMEASSKLGQPYGCFFQLLPLTKLPSTDLMNVLLDGVKRDDDGQAVLLRSGQDDAASDLLLNDKARRVLTTYLDGWRSKQTGDSDANALLFVTKANKPLSASTVSRKLRALQDAAGLPDFRITALRTIREPQPIGPGLKKTTERPHLHVVEEAEEEQAVLEVAEAALAGPPEEAPGPAELGDVSGSKTPAASSTPGREIRRMLPLRGVVYIKKRIDAGKTAYIGKYNIADVGEDEAIEPFIGRFLVPELGPGEYLVYDHARAMSPIHSFSFLDLSKSAERSDGSGRKDGGRSGEVHAVHPSPGPRGNTAYEDAYLTVRREEAARRRDEELQQTLKELRDENKRLRQELALMRRERDLSPMGVGPLPPLATPEDPLKAVYLDAVRRNQQIVDELIKKNLGVSNDASDVDQWDKFVALANGPLGRLLEAKFGSDSRGGRASSGPPPWARRSQASTKRPRPEPSESEPKPNRGAANAGVGDARGSKGDRVPGEDTVPDDEREVGRDLPATAIPFLEKMERAESEEELVENLLRVLAVLHLREDWRADIQGVFQLVIMNRADEALEASWALLRELVADGHLTDGAARDVVTAIHESWDGLRGRAIELAQQVAKRAQVSTEEEGGS